jgi:hypothetical protein
MSNIIRYTAANARMDKGRSRQSPNLSVRKEGTFRLNKAAMDLLGIKAEQHAEVLHDASSHEWYVRKGDKDGLPVRKGRNGAGFFRSVILHSAFAESYPDALESGNGRFLLATQAAKVDGVQAYAVLTSSSNKA